MQRKTIGIPDELSVAVDNYRHQQGIQSWSQSAMELLLLGGLTYASLSGDRDGDILKHIDGLFGESYSDWLRDNSHEINAVSEWQYLLEVLKPEWGGKRPGSGRKSEQSGNNARDDE